MWWLHTYHAVLCHAVLCALCTWGAGWVFPGTQPADGMTMVPACGAFASPASGVMPTPKESLLFGALGPTRTRVHPIGKARGGG